MARYLFALALFCAIPMAWGESILPTTQGTTWKYQMIQEFGKGVRPSAGQTVKVDSDGKVRLPVVIKVGGTEKIDGVEAHRFELHRQGAVQAVQFVQVSDQGVFELARGNGQGDKVKYNHPQKMLSFPLKIGEKWENHAEAGDQKVEEKYEVVGQEPVEVPAGKFNAYHVHVVGTEPFRSVVDRWYAPDVGEIKDVTEVRGSDGSMKTRISLELTALPAISNEPEIAATQPGENGTPTVAGPGPGKVKAEEAKEFADELAGDNEEKDQGGTPGVVSIPCPDGTVTVSLRTADGKPGDAIPAGTKKLLLHGELNGDEPTSVRVIYSRLGPKEGETVKWGESRLYLSKNNKTADTWIIINSGTLNPGNYCADFLIKDQKVATLPFKVVPSAEK